MHFHSFAAFHSKPSLMCPYGHGISSEGVRVLSFHRYHLKVFSICKYIKLKWSQTRTCFPHIAHPFKILSLIMFLRNICAFSEIPAKNKHYIVELNAAHFKFTIIYWNGNKLNFRFISSLSIYLPGQRHVPHLVYNICIAKRIKNKNNKNNNVSPSMHPCLSRYSF